MSGTNEQLSAILAAMEILPDGLFVVDRRQVIVGCNRVAEALFGYQHGELLEQPVHVLLPARARDVHRHHIDEFESVGGDDRPMSERPLLQGVTKDGSKIPVSIGISAVGTGQQRLYVAVVRDARSMDDTLRGAMLLAETDPLTSLGNRRYLSSWLEEHDSENSGHPVGLLFLDLDRFKPLNDQYGHEFGDEVLKIVANRLRGSLRASDLCVRFGGDEFAVLVVGISQPQGLRNVALKIHASVTAPIGLQGHFVSVGVSIGGALASSDNVDVETLFERADAAMYRAKKQSIGYCFDESDTQLSERPITE